MPANAMQFMMITSVPEIARFIEQCGVDRIMLDMENNGKDIRQKNLDLPIHVHSFDDVEKIKKSLQHADVMLRINPLHERTNEEVEKSLDAGADCIMLPYFHHQDEVKEFLDIVDGRAKTNILLETASAAARAVQILSLPGVEEVHFGLNDLKISLKHNFLFESLSGGLIDFLCSVARKNNLSYGIGGIGRIGKEILPADLVIKEYTRLNSHRTILSRVFHGNSTSIEELCSYIDFKKSIQELKEAEKIARQRTKEQEEKDTIEFCRKTDIISRSFKKV